MQWHETRQHSKHWSGMRQDPIPRKGAYWASSLQEVHAASRILCKVFHDLRRQGTELLGIHRVHIFPVCVQLQQGKNEFTVTVVGLEQGSNSILHSMRWQSTDLMLTRPSALSIHVYSCHPTAEKYQVATCNISDFHCTTVMSIDCCYSVCQRRGCMHSCNQAPESTDVAGGVYRHAWYLAIVQLSLN